MVKLKNAKIKTITEALRRMIDGDVFYFKGMRVSFELTPILHGGSPFVFSSGGRNLQTSVEDWLNVEEWDVEIT